MWEVRNMQENKNDKEEKITDLKGTIESLIEGEQAELSQEEAIKAYKGEGPQKPKKRKKSSSDEEDNDDDDILDEEHLKRLKQELLASLEKVNKLAKKLFGEKEFKNAKNLKVKEKYSKTQEKEQTISKAKQKEKEGKERSREE